MIKCNAVTSSTYAACIRQILPSVLTFSLLCAVFPTTQTQADESSPATRKLSPALKGALGNSPSQSVWLDVSQKTVRTLIQTNGPSSSGLIAAITLAGGSVVRQFTSINGLLA